MMSAEEGVMSYDTAIIIVRTETKQIRNGGGG